MGFFGSLFGEKNENKTKPIFECKTRQERTDWFARTRPWHKVPRSVIDAVVSGLENQPPVMLELFVHTSLKAGLVPAYERLADVQGDVVVRSLISGFFVKAGVPLVQQFMMKKQGFERSGGASERDVEALAQQAGVAKDCLELAAALHEEMASAYAPLALLLAETGEVEEGLKYARRGLAALKAMRSHSDDFRKSSLPEIRSAPDAFDGMELHMQQMIDGLTAMLRDTALSEAGIPFERLRRSAMHLAALRDPTEG